MITDYILSMSAPLFLSVAASGILLLLFILWLPLFSRSMLQVGLSRSHCYLIVGLLLLMCLSLVFSTSLLTTAVALEGLSFCSYVLAGNKPSLRVAASSYLYVVLGSLGTICLFVSLVPFLYACGSFSYSDVAVCLMQSREAMTSSLSLSLGIALFFGALLFKLAAAPFQSWQLEVYAATHNSIVALFGSVVKVAIFIALVRLFLFSFYPYFDTVCVPLLRTFGVASLFIGSCAGLFQTQIKRLLAYSSVFHTGFVLLCLSFACCDFTYGLLFSSIYLIVYVLAFLGTFIVLSIVEREKYLGSPIVYLADLVLVRERSAFFTICLVNFFFSFLGLPPLAGFFTKFLVLWLAVLVKDPVAIFSLLFFTIISSFYYLRLIFLAVFGKNISDLSSDRNRRVYTAAVSGELTLFSYLFKSLLPLCIFVGATLFFIYTPLVWSLCVVVFTSAGFWYRIAPFSLLFTVESFAITELLVKEVNSLKLRLSLIVFFLSFFSLGFFFLW